jgi:hypothetical protein
MARAQARTPTQDAIRIGQFGDLAIWRFGDRSPNREIAE